MRLYFGKNPTYSDPDSTYVYELSLTLMNHDMIIVHSMADKATGSVTLIESGYYFCSCGEGLNEEPVSFEEVLRHYNWSWHRSDKDSLKLNKEDLILFIED
jgi:hypothetical protein